MPAAQLQRIRPQTQVTEHLADRERICDLRDHAPPSSAPGTAKDIYTEYSLEELGQTKKGATGNEGEILNATLAVDGKSDRYPELKGNVATVYSHPLSKGGASNGHYDGKAETYMNIGEAMGKAMVELVKD